VTDDRKSEFTVTMLGDPAEQAAFIKALVPPAGPAPDIEAIRDLWIRVSLGYEDAAKEAGAVGLQHVAFLLSEVERLSRERERILKAVSDWQYTLSESYESVEEFCERMRGGG
jgi:hypothetical protein